jgi:hypothetical protein
LLLKFIGDDCTLASVLLVEPVDVVSVTCSVDNIITIDTGVDIVDVTVTAGGRPYWPRPVASRQLTQLHCY